MTVTTGPNLGKMINALTGDAFDIQFRSLLRAVDVLVQPAVISKTLTAPPGSPTNGDRYIVAASPTGAWSGQAKSIAVWTTDDPASPSGVWQFYVPKAGWLVFNVADATFYDYTGSAWTALSAGGGGTGGDSLNPRQYGALGNGSTDDYAAILACYTDAVLLGKKIGFDAGIYPMSQGLAITDDDVDISGVEGTILKRTAASGGDVGALLFIKSNNCRIAGLELDGNKSGIGSPVGTPSGIFIDSSASKGRQNTVSHCRIHDHLGHGIGMDGQTHGTTIFNEISGCYVSANGGVGVAQNAAPDNWIHDCILSGNFDEGLTIDNQSHRCRVENNRITGNCTGGGVAGIGIDFSDLFVITGNIIDGNTLSGIKTQNNLGVSNYGTCVGNLLLQNTGYGLWLFAGTGGTSNWWVISGNTVRSNTVGPIHIDAGCNNNTFGPQSLNGTAIGDSGSYNRKPGLELIAEVITSGVGTVTFSSIPQTYRDLVLVVRGAGTKSAAFANLGLTLNGDTGTNYDQEDILYNNTTFTGNGGAALTSLFAGWVPAATAPSNAASSSEIELLDYARTVFHKSLLIRGGLKTGSAAANMFAAVGAAFWRSTAAITSLAIAVDSNNFVDGSVVSLYGRN